MKNCELTKWYHHSSNKKIFFILLVLNCIEISCFNETLVKTLVLYHINMTDTSDINHEAPAPMQSSLTFTTIATTNPYEPISWGEYTLFCHYDLSNDFEPFAYILGDIGRCPLQDSRIGWIHKLSKQSLSAVKLWNMA